MAFPWKVGDIRLSQRNAGKRLDVIVIASAGKMDGGGGLYVPGETPTITSSIYIMAEEVHVTDGKQLIPGMLMLPI